MNTFEVLIAVAGGLAIASLIKPTWPLLGASVLLICVALYVKG